MIQKMIQKTADLVRDAEVMDDEFFCMHMSKRHQDSLAGQSFIEPAGDATEAYRAFHDRLHRLRVDLVHEHEKVMPKE